MPVHPVDSEIYDWKFGTDAMRAVWSEESLLESWLDVEAALAESQSDLGLIPHEAAEAIAATADTDHVTVEEVARRFRETNLDSVAMIKTLAAAVPEQATEFVHWGATTTDVTETGLSLQIRGSIDVLQGHLRELEDVLLDLASTHRETLVVARTHSQHALPMTFGLKAARWARETRRLYDSFDRVREEVCLGKIVGAAGTYASFEGKGPELEARVCDRLGLTPADNTIQESQARFWEYLHVLGTVATTYQRVANEVWNRQRTEINELREPFVAGKNTGSSTLAFKRNPFECEWIRSVAALVKNQANAIRDLNMEDERDGTRFAFYRALVPTASTMTDAVVTGITRVLDGLEVNEDVMRENVDMLDGFVMSESVMMALAREGAGKQTAHEILYDCATLALEERLTLTEALHRDGRALNYVDEDDLVDLLTPENYLGESVALVDRTIEQLRSRRAD
jgi:adenylosuccinate lyase